MSTPAFTPFIAELSAPVTWHGVTFSAVRIIALLDGEAGFSVGYRFRPLEDRRAEDAAEPLWVELPGEFFASAAMPTEENAVADIEAYLANPPVPAPSVEQVWANWLAGSIVDEVTGIALKANRQARNDFIGQATLLREALDAGAVTGDTLVPIWDASNVQHSLTVTACRALLLRYGFAWQQAFNQLAP